MGEPLLERLRSLDRRELVGLVAVALLIVGGAALWYVRSMPSSVRIDASTERSDRGAAAGATPTVTPAVVIVDVAGWVRRPGVYEFRQGDRVIDAIRLAGGARSGANLQSINLAALLVDGQQIVVPKRGKGVPDAGTSGGAVPGSGGAEALININTATLDQLESLPGIGPALAQRILDYREQHGPFRKVEDLLNVSGIGEKRLADLRPNVTV